MPRMPRVDPAMLYDAIASDTLSAVRTRRRRRTRARRAGNSCPKLIFSLFGKGDEPGCRNRRGIDPGFRRGRPFAVAPTKQKTGLHRPGAVGQRPASRQRSAQVHVGLLVNGSPWRQNIGPAVNRSQFGKRDHQRSSVIGDEIGLTGRHCHVNRVEPQRPAWIPFQAAALAVSHTLNASFRNRLNVSLLHK